MKKTSEAQLKASSKWNQENKEKMNYIRKRSAARGFIKIATEEDLTEIMQLVAERKMVLNQDEKNKPNS